MIARTKLWLGIGAFAAVSAGGITYDNGRPSLTIAQPAEAACGWSKGENGWYYDSNCERGERYNPRPGYNTNERGYYYYRHDNGYHRGWERGERGRYNEQGGRWEGGYDRWGERG
jgi:hypothetical protein